MTAALQQLAAVARAATLAREKAIADPLSAIDWLKPQDDFLRCTSRIKLLRAGNQVIGKSTVGLAECIYVALCKHPYRQLSPDPKEVWLLCASWSQSVAIQKKLWDLVPKSEIEPGQKFDPGRGLGGHHPTLRFRNGSLIRIKTTQQGALALAGATIDFALFDEPPHTRSVYTEVVKRVQYRGGTVALTMTPVNGPVDYLQELVDSGIITDLHYPLTEPHLTHVRSGQLMRLKDGTICNAAWIAELERQTLSYEVPVRVHGSWEMKTVDRIFETFEPTKHVSAALPVGEALFYLGIDHGDNVSKAKQAVVLLALQDVPGSKNPRIWVLDEWKPTQPGGTTPEEDAEAIFQMLDRHGLKWGNLDFAFGDKPTGEGMTSKGNVSLEVEIAKRLNVRREAVRPRIYSAKRGKGASDQYRTSVRYLHHQIQRGHVVVHPRCVQLIESLQRWDGSKDSPHKDVIDALRYALMPEIRGLRSRLGQTTIRNW